MSFDFDIGNRIKNLSDKEGLNQRELAEKIGLFSADHLRKIERGDIKEPKYSHLVAISDYFGVSTDYFLKKKDSYSVMPKNPGDLSFGMQTEMGKQAIMHLNKCATSIRKLDVAAYVGLEVLEDRVKQLDEDPEAEKFIKIIKQVTH